MTTVNSGVRTAHTSFRCELDSGYHDIFCMACDGCSTLCSECNGEGKTLTTDCPGWSGANNLILSLVYRGGLDYVDGTWTWKRDTFAFQDTHHIVQVEYRGSIDRFIEYADNRMRNAHAECTFYKRQSADKRLTVSVTRYQAQVGA